MARKTLPLGALEIERAKAGNKPQHLFDGGGLFLLVATSGGKWWRFKYSHSGKSKTISFGTYPEISLAQAREKREEARKLLAAGVDPSTDRKAVKAAKIELLANSFECIAREWHKKMLGDSAWTADHADTIMTRMEKDMFPRIGGKPITEVTAKDIRTILDQVKERGAVDTARRCRTIASQVFVYAIGTDRAEYNIATSLSKHLPAVSKTRKHMSSITDPKELAPLLRAIDGYQGGFVAKSALQLLPLLFVRPGELRHMEWSEIDFEVAEWNIPAQKMKMKVAHLVPLSVRAIEILTALKPLTGNSKYVFPSTRSFDRCMSDNTINAAFRRMDFDGDTITGHGFRATARTILDEILGFRVDFIEHQLAHAVKDPNGRAYNRTAHLDERKKMMQLWADYLDGLKAGAKVLPFKQKAA
ncbi:MAG: integrase arm-type DNA-binding domain-containing protein [Proteobacteria bacterium]|nr:integrase arm-type DNA-binding domain-containing protein [Pseudomonadota bacterium]